MTLNLYHGTSAIFLDSILKNGLGGINPNFHYRNLDLVKFLWAESEKVLTDNAEYQKMRRETTAVANQTDLILESNQGKNFVANYRHDGIYTAYTIERAAYYACDNQYGSEILEFCIRLYKLLKKNDEKFELPDDLNLFKIENYINVEHKPILIKILNVNDNEIETEHGEKASNSLKALESIQRKIGTKRQILQFQYLNFKLLNPIFKNRLQIYEIEFTGNLLTDDFEFTLNEITCR